jgi:CheY-like chemotaxis protein
MNGSVLVVEDDPSVAEATGLLLERAGLRVVAAPDG